MTRILVPLAHSPGNDHVLDYAAALAKGSDGTITLFHVYEPPGAMVGIVPGATVEGELAADRAASGVLLDDAQATLARLGVPAVSVVLERGSSPHDAIVAHARGFDLIVMGTHGRRGLDRVLLGSIAERVIRDAPCPVVTVHL